MPAEPSSASREAVRARREARQAVPPPYRNPTNTSPTKARGRGAGRPAAPQRELPQAASSALYGVAPVASRITVHTADDAVMEAVSDGPAFFNYRQNPATRSSMPGSASPSDAAKPTSVTQSGWSRWMGSGTFSCGGSAGLSEGFLENSQGAPTAIVYQPDEPQATSAIKGGNYRLLMQFKCAHAAPASGNRPGFDLLLAVRWTSDTPSGWDSLQCTLLCVDCVDRVWTLQCRDGTGTLSQCQFEDRELRPGVLHSIRLEVKGGSCLSVWCDGRQIVSSFEMPAGAQLHGPLGLGVTASRLDWKKWKIESCNRQAQASAVQDLDVAPRATEAYSGGDPGLVDIIERDVLDRDLGVTFDDIASLDNAKRTLNEAVTLPLIIPEYFTGIREPWKGVLLFGPPGTGKTLLAKAVASMNNVKFFNCSSATLTSKWRGESEKLVKELFQMARHYAPSIIFFDEVDALVSPRGSDGEHEASRRFKAELLSQMDGIGSSSEAGRNVMVLATTNCPWDLDEAIRRRLEKRIYIPLPDRESRASMFQIHMRGVACDQSCSFGELADITEGYSGADIKVICRDASLMPMRRLVADRTPQEIVALKAAGRLDVSLSQADFKAALENTSRSVAGEDIQKFEEWDGEFASA